MSRVEGRFVREALQKKGRGAVDARRWASTKHNCCGRTEKQRLSHFYKTSIQRNEKRNCYFTAGGTKNENMQRHAA